MNPQGDQTDYSQPVAYDEHGRPLYAHPPQIISQQPVKPIAGPAPQITQRQNMPNSLTEDVRKLHMQSEKKYPNLNLSDGEYVIRSFRRHPIGLVSIWGLVLLAVAIVLMLPIMFYGLGIDSTIRLTATATVALGMILLGIIVLALIAGMIATYVYESNAFYLTNENVTQRIQAGLFSRKIQTISLGSVEDVSYRRSGILQTILNYGSIRLSTEGEETTYRFNFVAGPEEQVHLINDAMEDFRNSHPVADSK